MQLARLTDAPGYDDARFVAVPFLQGTQCNARVIRLSPGQSLPSHTHGVSDLMLYVVEGAGTIATPDGPADFAAGSLAHLRGDEQLDVANTGGTGMTLLAVLAPPFPPSSP